MNRKISIETLTAKADKLGIQLEFKVSYVRIVGEEGKWTDRHKMFNRLNGRLRRMKLWREDR